MTERPPVGNEECSRGIVTGAAGVEALDFDAAGLLLDSFLEQLEDIDSGLANRLYIERSPSGGAHIVYTCDQPARNTKLATVMVAATPGPMVVQRGRKEYPIRVSDDGKTWQDLGSKKSYAIENGVVPIKAIETRGAGGC